MTTPENVHRVRDHFTRWSATLVEMDVAAALRSRDILLTLRSVLPFPDQCGDGWDLSEDCLDELRDRWHFPLVIIVRGLDDLLVRNGPVGLQAVIQLAKLSGVLSMRKSQLHFVYVVSDEAGNPQAHLGGGGL